MPNGGVKYVLFIAVLVVHMIGFSVTLGTWLGVSNRRRALLEHERMRCP